MIVLASVFARVFVFEFDCVCCVVFRCCVCDVVWCVCGGVACVVVCV